MLLIVAAGQFLHGTEIISDGNWRWLGEKWLTFVPWLALHFNLSLLFPFIHEWTKQQWGLHFLIEWDDDYISNGNLGEDTAPETFSRFKRKFED